MSSNTARSEIHKRIRTALHALQTALRRELMAVRAAGGGGEFAVVSAQTAADTLYAVDALSERLILDWLATHWPVDAPVELVMEGLDDGTTYPAGTAVAETDWKLIIDPIDGTRNLMYDKRSAWFLAGVAPQAGAATRLQDIEVAVMGELPNSKQWRADVFTWCRGGAPRGEAVNILNGRSEHLASGPSQAVDVRHGFGTITRFFPDGLELLGAVEEAFWQRLYPEGQGGSPLVFNDQYLTTGGQLYELMMGHDRFTADLRPLALRKLGLEAALCCHPYDLAALPIAEACGLVIEDPLTGGPVDAPLDTLTPVAWVGYANPALAAALRPVLRAVLNDFGLA